MDVEIAVGRELTSLPGAMGTKRRQVGQHKEVDPCSPLTSYLLQATPAKDMKIRKQLGVLKIIETDSTGDFFFQFFQSLLLLFSHGLISTSIQLKLWTNTCANLKYVMAILTTHAAKQGLVS